MNPQQTQLTPELIKLGTIRECKNCDSILFDNTTAVVKLSKIISPSGEDLELPIRVMICRKCGVIPDWSDPDNLLPDKLKQP